MNVLKPQLSVVIPCFDDGHYLVEAVQSVLQQAANCARNLPSFEILVVNDNSKDEATLKALECVRRLDKVQILQNDRKPGVAGARNTGIEAARSEWIAFLDADDRWLENAIAVRWAVLDEYPEAQWISADFRLFHENEATTGAAFLESRPKPSAMLREAFALGRTLRLRRPLTQFLESSLTWTGTVLVKRSLLLRLDGFEESLIRAQDTHLWFKLANETDFFFVPEVVAEHRQRKSTRINRGHPPGQWEIMALEQLLENPAFQKHHGQIKKRIARRLLEDLNFHRAQGNRCKGLKTLGKSLRHSPFRLPVWKAGAALIIGRK